MSKRELIEISEYLGEPKFTIEITDERGSHTETVGLETLKVILEKVDDIEISEIIEDELNAMDLGYIEIAQEQDGETGKPVFDIYDHWIYAENGILTMNKEGKFLKTYVREKSAIKFAQKTGKLIIEN